jgi:hypothetical protein
VILHETFPLALRLTGTPSDAGPSVRLSARLRTLRIERELPASAGRRTWRLVVEVEVPEIDPERVLLECEGFLVDGHDGRGIGVVDRVEITDGLASALIVAAGWFGRRRLRVDAQAIDALVPGERRVIVDESSVSAAGGRSRSK